jgi:DNA primase
LMCTTRGGLYEDNMGRMFAVSVDETPDQTQRIVTYQNQVAAGIINKQEENAAIDFIQNLMRMVGCFATVNPFANKVQLPKEAHKIRRLNELFHGLIKMMTLLHQYQRQKDDKGRIITTPYDIQKATDIMFSSILLKVDELDGALRDFYEQLKGYLKHQYNGQHKESTFTQREIRQYLKVSKSQLQRYIFDLSELEYIAKKGGYSNRGYLYTLLYWDDFNAVKERIKKDLYNQINQLTSKKEVLQTVESTNSSVIAAN